MAVSLNSVVPFNSVSKSCMGSLTAYVPSGPVFIKSRRNMKSHRNQSYLLVANSDRVITDRGENSNGESITSSERSIVNDPKLPTSSSEASVGSSATGQRENNISSSADAQSIQKKVPLTARERLRAARVLSRYSESKPVKKSEIGRSVLDALRESEKGKKGLPQAPTNIFDDSQRGMPKAGLTFDFPGGFDLFVIVLSFVLISTIMFATTFFVWKVGAIHFNDN